MISELVVRNLGILAETRIEPGPGLTVVTGETGTGKTALLGALRLLLGDPGRSELVGPFAEEAVVEGRFHSGEEEIIAGRRLPRDGRSRAYLDGGMASLPALAEAVGGLVEMIGQHDHLSLTRPAEGRALVDRLLSDAGRKRRDEYEGRFREWGERVAERDRLGGDRTALERERETARLQAREIAAAAPRVDEDAELAETLARLRHADRLRELLAGAAGAVDDAREGIGRASGALRRGSELAPGLGAHAETAAVVEGGLGDLAAALTAELEGLEADPDTLAAAEQRYHVLTDLRRRYGPGLADVLSYGKEAAARSEELTDLLARADAVTGEVAAAAARLEEAGERLREARTEAGARLAAAARAHLVELGFVRPALAVAVEPGPPGPGGADVCRLRFASDDRLALGDVAKVASGGELSRLVLALRLAGGAGEAATVAFDEIDAGVGGVTALALGRKLAALAERRQVLCVTHLPQVAAFGETHYVVTRDGNVATVERVDGERRVAELARMLAGLPDSERGKEAASELMAIARSRG